MVKVVPYLRVKKEENQNSQNLKHFFNYKRLEKLI